jgi:hypothetical protein
MTTIWETFDCFLAGELPLEDLVEWVAGTPALADVLAPEELRRLRGIEPAERHAFRDATAWVAAIYETHRPGRLDRDRAARIAGGMLAGEIDAAAGTRVLAQLRAAGAEWIPEAFTGLAAALDDLPQPSADPLADAPGFAARVSAALERARQLRAPALVAARRLLDRLEDRMANPTKRDGETT